MGYKGFRMKGAPMQDKAKNAGKVAIVLEGGSFRGEFTAGVLDVLMENGVEVAACYGTSAGALNGLNYKSRQIGRVNRVNLAFCNDPRYMGAHDHGLDGRVRFHPERRARPSRSV